MYIFLLSCVEIFQDLTALRGGRKKRGIFDYDVLQVLVREHVQENLRIVRLCQVVDNVLVLRSDSVVLHHWH